MEVDAQKPEDGGPPEGPGPCDGQSDDGAEEPAPLQAADGVPSEGAGAADGARVRRAVGLPPAAIAEPGEPAAAGEDGAGTRPAGSRSARSLSGWSATDALSVRTDWSSTDGSPRRPAGDSAAAVMLEGFQAEADDAEQANGVTNTRSVGEDNFRRSGRRTLTSMMPVDSHGKAPVRYGVHSIQNLRSEMEDAHRAVIGNECIDGATVDALSSPLGSLSYFAIFDGHGGARAAEFSSERLCALLAAQLDNLQEDPEGALRGAFARTEAEWLELARSEELMDGTTAAVAIVDRLARRCIVGNVGDSEVILGTRDASGQTGHATLTEVHHLKRSPSEASRVETVGGRVWRGRLGHPRISPQVLSLSVSRAIGDLFFKDDRYTDGQPSGLTADPYINSVEVCTTGVVEQFLVIGCDGLWDTVTYAEAAELVFSKLEGGEEPQAISEALVRLARDAGSSDNITVIVVVL